MSRSFMEIDERYRPALEQRRISRPDQLLALPAVIVSGHPNRNVARITIGENGLAIPAFLKCEHRVLWKDRLANAFAGFGFVSRSQREFQVLRSLQKAGIACPDPIAAGEDGQGRAFVIVRDLPGTLDLRVFLNDRKQASAYQRCRFARKLGEALARVHDAGFHQPDMYAKHVLVEPVSEKLSFLDWQRSRKHAHLSWSQRWAGLAALDATLTDELATVKERLLCLRAYCRASAQVRVPRSFLAEACSEIQRRSRKLQRRRRIREQRRLPLDTGAQDLIWLKGEALVVTQGFQEECCGQMPDWLTAPSSWRGRGEETRRSVVSLPAQRKVLLTRRRASRPGTWLWHILRRHRLESPELQQAAAIFRLQRFGLRTLRLLAFGQHHPSPWCTESFLLTDDLAEAPTLTSWLRRQTHRPLWTAECKQRRHLLREAGDCLRRIHDAGYRGRTLSRLFLVHPLASGATPALVLGTLDCLDYRRSTSTSRAQRDLGYAYALLESSLASRADALRCLLSYLGLRRLNPQARHLARSLARPKEQSRSRNTARVSPALRAVSGLALSGHERALS